MANGLPIHVNNPSTELELLYIDDLVNELLEALEGHEDVYKRQQYSLDSNNDCLVD